MIEVKIKKAGNYTIDLYIKSEWLLDKYHEKEFCLDKKEQFYVPKRLNGTFYRWSGTPTYTHMYDRRINITPFTSKNVNAGQNFRLERTTNMVNLDALAKQYTNAIREFCVRNLLDNIKMEVKIKTREYYL